MTEKVIEIKDLVIKFNLRGRKLTAVRSASLQLYKGETLAVVGESGSGKSVLTKALIGMTDKNGWIESGSIDFKGEKLSGYSKEKQWESIRGKRIAMVFQDPMTALNPLKKIGEQIKEMLLLHTGRTDREAADRALELMEKVGIADAAARYHQYPHEFSGGMRQRIVIAAAIAANPEVLICDEPTTALDVTLQAQILELIKSLQKEFGLSIIFITHDLGVVANIADRVAVMYAGEIIETGTAEEIFHTPVHPYTKALLNSLPQLGIRGEELPAIKGTPPNLFREIKGDAFAPRNPQALKIDFEEAPPYFEITKTHYAKTWTMHPFALERYEKPADAERVLPVFAEGTDINRNSKEPDSKKEPMIKLSHVSVSYGSGKKKYCAVDDVSFEIYEGETFSLVGESGSGKTTIGRAIMKIIPVSNGTIAYKGQQINGKMKAEALKKYRQNVQMIFQDPMASLNERAKVDYIISEGIYNFKLFENEEDRKRKVAEVMQKVGLVPEYASRFPHEFSGGQRQRLGIARALIMQPSFIIADEPISALDVSIRAQVINLLNELKRENNLTYLFIAHDLSVVRFLSDRIAVIYKGKIVELAECEELFSNPVHPYTKALLSAVPVPEPETERGKSLIRYNPSGEEALKDKKSWCKLKEGHYVLAGEKELEQYLRDIR